MRADLNDPGVARCAPSLLRYARALGGPERLTLRFFLEEVHYTATGYEVLNLIDLTRFHELDDRERPRDRGGLMRWRLRAKDVQAVKDLDEIVRDVLTRMCSREVIVVRKERARDIIFRFVIAADNHAHVGVIGVYGDGVREFLAGEGRRRAQQAPAAPEDQTPRQEPHR